MVKLSMDITDKGVHGLDDFDSVEGSEHCLFFGVASPFATAFPARLPIAAAVRCEPKG